MKKLLTTVFLLTVLLSNGYGQKPVRIAVAGLSHSHVVPLLRNLNRTDIEIVGIYETDTALYNRYAAKYSLNKTIIYESLEEMLDKTKPEGVITFTSIFDHLKVVKACAPRKIHVMVEKPLAVSTRHADEMASLSERYGIRVLTNYETSWYPTNHTALEMINKGDIGPVRKIIVYDGHKGPKEIRTNNEFLAWLTDPVLNGGGAVIDFGCYGADLITWIRKGEKPTTVFARLKQYKPDVYPKVDDDATILLSYPDMEGVILASWGWPFNRKDMHIYGTTGYLLVDNGETMRYRLDEKSREETRKIEKSAIPYTDPFTWFAAVIKGDVTVSETDLASLKINRTVVEILDAARESGKTGKLVKLSAK
jgi:predicted dehydrogenase